MKRKENAPSLLRREFIRASLVASGLVATQFFPIRSSRGANSGSGRLFRVPYYSGRSDLEAGVACARMILNFFEPDEHFPYADVVEMISHREGYWVFEAQLLPLLMKKGYRAGLHASTPYRELAQGRAQERYGPEAKRRIDTSALAWANRFLSEKNFRQEETSFESVLSWLAKGELLMLSVSRAVLRQDSALPYCRYQILPLGLKNQLIIYHDPSLGPFRQVPLELLRQAFQAPGTDRAVLRLPL